MALLATSFTVEIILLLIGLYFFDGGLIRKIGAMGFFVLGLQLSYGSQKYVSDATNLPTNTSLIFTPEIQSALTILFAICTLITFALFTISVARIFKYWQQGGKMTMTLIYEEVV